MKKRGRQVKAPAHKANRRPSSTRQATPAAARASTPVPDPRSRIIRPHLVLQESGWARLHKSEKSFVPPRGGLLLSHIFEDVFLAFKGAGIDGPYCQFVRQLPKTREDLQRLSDRVKAAGSVEQASLVTQAEEATFWVRVDEHAQSWDRIVFAPRMNAATLWFLDAPRRYGTGSGRVEQWLTLSHVLVGNLSLLQDGVFDGAGRLRDARPPLGNELVIGSEGGRPIVACSQAKELLARENLNGMAEDDFILSAGGVALLVWAVMQQRLKDMYEEISVETRLRMGAVGEFMSRRTAAMSWKHSDFELLRRVEQELIAAAPNWRGTEAGVKPTDPPPGQLGARSPLEVPLLAEHESLLEFFDKHRTRVLTVTSVAAIGPNKDREKAGQLCRELGDYNLLERKKRNKGWNISGFGIQRAAANRRRQ